LKRKLLVVFIFALPLFGKCQGYQSLFGQDSTTWNTLIIIIDGGYTIRYQATADTFFYNNHYKKVSDGYQRTGYIREDTASGKAWYYSVFSNAEKMIMDLSLQLGDTFMIYEPWDSIPAIVDSVYFTSSGKHIRFDITVIWNDTIKFEFIEGVGPNAGITYQGETFGWNTVSNMLLCKYTDSVQVFSNTLFNGICDIDLIGIKEHENTLFNIFPNPIRQNESLKIRNSNDQIESIQLIDLPGNIQYLDPVHLVITQKPGLYFIKINHSSGQSEIQKLVIID
jgi:hypothetical protein